MPLAIIADNTKQELHTLNNLQVRVRHIVIMRISAPISLPTGVIDSCCLIVKYYLIVFGAFFLYFKKIHSQAVLIDKIILVGECIIWRACAFIDDVFSSSTQLQFYFNYKTDSSFVREQNSHVFLWDSSVYRAI